MADKEHAEWAANRKAQKEARLRMKKEKEEELPGATAAPDEPTPRADNGDADEDDRVSLGR